MMLYPDVYLFQEEIVFAANSTPKLDKVFDKANSFPMYHHKWWKIDVLAQEGNNS